MKNSYSRRISRLDIAKERINDLNIPIEIIETETQRKNMQTKPNSVCKSSEKTYGHNSSNVRIIKVPAGEGRIEKEKYLKR